MNSYEKNFLKYLNNKKINACKECTLEELNSDDFYMLTTDCEKCINKYCGRIINERLKQEFENDKLQRIKELELENKVL